MNATHGQRLAALLLAGWSPADRHWALAQLGGPQQDALRPLIDEAARLTGDAGLPLDVLRGLGERAHAFDAMPSDASPLQRYVDTLPAAWAARMLHALDIAIDAVEWLGHDPRRAARIVDQRRRMDALPPALADALRRAAQQHAGARHG